MYLIHADQMTEGEKIGEKKKVDEIVLSGVGGLWALVSFFNGKYVFPRLVDGLIDGWIDGLMD